MVVLTVIALFICISSARAATRTYTYDALNRLTQVTYRTGAQTTYTYDAAGNRLTLVATSPRFTLTVAKSGTGAGTVTAIQPAAPPGINCDPTCSADYPAGTQVTLIAAPLTGSAFDGWLGEGCTGTGTCTVEMSQARSIAATFALGGPTTYALTVTTAGTGSGSVTSNPSGIDCGVTCSAAFATGTGVSLTPTAALGSTFTGWTGDPDCADGSVTMTQQLACTATFTLQPPQNPPPAPQNLTVLPADCAAPSCLSVSWTDVSGEDGYKIERSTGVGGTFAQVATVAPNTTTYLDGYLTPGTTYAYRVRAYNAAGYSDWSNVATAVPAVSVRNQLSVTLEGLGKGNAISTPAGINCSPMCAATFSDGASVRLEASASVGSRFAGWTGAGCSGTGSCTVAMTQARNVTATFETMAPPIPGFALYDDFSGSQIDGAKWQNLEFVREIRNGRLALKYRATGTPGRSSADVQLANPSTIHSVEADVRLNAYTIPAGGHSRVQLGYRLYNDGTTNAGRTGDVTAVLYITGRTTGDGADVWYSVSKCADSGCAGGVELIPATTLKSAALGEPHRLGIRWDGSALTFAVDGQDTVVDPTAVQPIVNANPNVHEKWLNARLGFAGAGGAGFVDGDFDNVYVNGVPYDDFDGAPFSGPRLDPSRWQYLEYVNEVAGGKFVSRATTPGPTEARVWNNLRFLNGKLVDAVRTDLTVTAVDTTNNAYAQATPLGGCFYNDGSSTVPGGDYTGDITAYLWVYSQNGGPLTTQFQVRRCADTSCNSEPVLYSDTLGTINVAETHAYLLKWDGAIFTYGMDGTTRTLDPRTVNAPPMLPPSMLYKTLRTFGNIGSGGHGYIAAEFDNVYVNAEASPLPKLSPFVTETVAGDVTSAGVGLRGTGYGTINLTAVPTGATVVRAYLYWATLGTAGTFTAPTLNGTAVGGALIGQSDDPRWGARQSYAYRADVTSLVSGNGAYAIAGLPALGPTVNDTEGASLVVLYALPGVNLRKIAINDGAVTLVGGRIPYYETTLSSFTAATPPTGSKATFIGGSGQTNTPEYAGLNATRLSTNDFSGSDGNYWDTRTYDVSSALAGGATNATAVLSSGNESLVWVAAILSVPEQTHRLTVTPGGTGTGVITSDPPGINCGPTCFADYPAGATVSLIPIATSGFTFTGWSGDCAGTGACVVSMTQARSVTATFLLTRPDLVETALSNPPATAMPTTRFTVTDTVRNQGVSTAGKSVTRYYLSLDAIVSADDIRLNGRAIPNLSPGAESVGTATISIPQGSAPGIYYLLACADDGAAVVEGDETNNCRAAAGTVQVGRADLVETSVTGAPVTATSGSSFTVTDTVRNQGASPAAASVTRYYLSLNPQAPDIRLTGIRNVPSLAPGADSAGSATVTLPKKIAPGSYYLLSCADDTKRVAEDDETNNCRAATSTIAVGQ
jgi:YD repeat-containing protein